MTTLAGDDPTGIPMQALLLYFKAMLNPGRGVLLFALRTIAAGLLTLYLAFLFDLDQPKWSIMAVVIVSQPLAGMALARSFGQVIGTTLGAVVAVLIMAIFPQAPLPFILTLALWLALCTAGGTLYRYTSSQAFVLSGYTAVIVALLAVPDQDGTFLLAVTRVTETLLAVACVCVVSLLTARPEAVARDYFARIDQVIKLLATHAAAVIRTEESEADFRQRQMKLLGEISALEGVRRHLYFDAPRLRSANGLVQLLGNQLVLLTSRLMALRHQRELLLERWKGALPVDSQRLLAEELVFLDEVARQGRSLSTEARHPFTALQQRFDELAYRSERRNQVAANRGGRPGPDRIDERGNLRRHGEKRCLRHRRPGKPARRPIVGQHQSQLHLGQTGAAGAGADTDRCRLCG